MKLLLISFVNLQQACLIFNVSLIDLNYILCRFVSSPWKKSFLPAKNSSQEIPDESLNSSVGECYGFADTSIPLNPLANLSALIALDDSDDSDDESDVSFVVVRRQGDSPVTVCAGPQVGGLAVLSGGDLVYPQVGP